MSRRSLLDPVRVVAREASVAMAALALWLVCESPVKAEQPAGPWNLGGRPPHLVAHYMPWFQIQKTPSDSTPTWAHWKWTGGGATHHPEDRRPDGLRDIASIAYPLIGPYASWSREVVRYHLKTAQAAGIQAFLLIWYGPGSYEDDQVAMIMDEAEKIGMRIAICYEEKINFPAYRSPSSRAEIVANVVKDLGCILERYAAHPAYLRRNGAPFVAQFNGWGAGPLGPKFLTPSEWRQVFEKLPSPVIFCRQNLDESYHPGIASAYIWWTSDIEWLERFSRRAAEMRAEGRLQFFLNMICPGFDDTGVWGWGAGPRKIERQGLSILRDTFDRAFARAPELIQVVTWNDFAEGTVMEPTRENGFWYLDAMETWWGETTGRRVDLADNRQPFLDYAKACSAQERKELPPLPYDDFLKKRPLAVENPNILADLGGKK